MSNLQQPGVYSPPPMDMNGNGSAGTMENFYAQVRHRFPIHPPCSALQSFHSRPRPLTLYHGRALTMTRRVTLHRWLKSRTTSRSSTAT